MYRWVFGRFLVPCLCLLVLSSCISLEKAQLAFTEDSSGQITLRLAGEDDDSLEVEEMIAQIQNCGFKGRTFRRGADILVDAQYEFDNQTIMNSNLDCLPLQWSRREVSLDVSKGLLWTTYTTSIWIEQPTVVPAIEPVDTADAVVEVETEVASEEGSDRQEQASAQDAAETPETDEAPALPETAEASWEQSYPLFPMQLTVRVPGNIGEVSTEGSDLFSAELTSDFSNNRATIEMIARTGWTEQDEERAAAELEELTEALNDGEEREIPLYSYKVEIESTESHLNLSTLLTVLGLLFGSGLVGRLFAVRAAKSRETPKES